MKHTGLFYVSLPGSGSTVRINESTCIKTNEEIVVTDVSYEEAMALVLSMGVTGEAFSGPLRPWETYNLPTG